MTVHPSPPTPLSSGLSEAALTNALRATGALSPGRRVAEVHAAPMEGGYLAHTQRLVLRYDGELPEAAPRTLVAKSPAADEQALAVATWLGLYARELGFYRELAPHLDVRTPHCYGATHDPSTGDFLLLLEDVAPATVHDQAAACPTGDALLAIDQLARLHAAHWNDPRLAELDWLNHLDAEQITTWHQLYTYAWGVLMERDPLPLSAELRAVGQRVADSDMVAWITDYDGPLALTHADFHLSNLLFARGEVVTVDWQMAMQAPPLIDVAFFLGRMPTADRRAIERDVLRAYHDRLVASGVAGYSFADCLEEYERSLWFGALSAVAASATKAFTARYEDKIARYFMQAIDHGSARFLA